MQATASRAAARAGNTPTAQKSSRRNAQRRPLSLAGLSASLLLALTVPVHWIPGLSLMVPPLAQALPGTYVMCVGRGSSRVNAVELEPRFTIPRV